MHYVLVVLRNSWLMSSGLLVDASFPEMAQGGLDGVIWCGKKTSGTEGEIVILHLWWGSFAWIVLSLLFF